MILIKTEEITENGTTYVVNTYDNGTIEKYIKPDPAAEPPEPEPQDPPVTNDELQAQIAELQEQNVAIMMGLVDMFAAITNTGGAE